MTRSERQRAGNEPGAGAGDVVLGGLALQDPDYALHGIGRYAARYHEALRHRLGEGLLGIASVPGLPTGGAGRRISHGRGPATRNGGPLVFHELAPFASVPLADQWPRWARRPQVGCAVTLYDLIPLRLPHIYLRGAGRFIYQLRLDFVRVADAVLVLSDSTAADGVDLAGLDPRRVHVVGSGSGLPDPARERSPAASLARAQAAIPGLRSGAILTLSGTDERKNTRGVIDAYAALSPLRRLQHQLLVVGASTMAEAYREHARALGVERQVLFARDLSDAELAGAYESCELFIFASQAEGFGLPVLEALQHGAPLLVSDIPALRELVPDSRARFIAGSHRLLCAALERMLADDALREELRRQGPEWAARHSWARVVDRSLEAYEAAAARRARLPGRPAPDLAELAFAFVASENSGATDDDGRLAAALAERVTMRLYLAGGQPAAGAHGRVAELETVEEFAHSMPSLLLSIADSPAHAEIWRLLIRHGGDVLLHTPRLDRLQAVLRARAAAVGDPQPPADPLRSLLDAAAGVYVFTDSVREALLATAPERGRDICVIPRDAGAAAELILAAQRSGEHGTVTAGRSPAQVTCSSTHATARAATAPSSGAFPSSLR